jgi:acyl-CoA thioesterase-1
VHPRARRLVGWYCAGVGVVLTVVALTPIVAGAALGSTTDRCTAFARESVARQRLVTGHGERTVVIGDSYSAGLGLRRPGDSWAAELPGRVHVYGFSGSGFSRGASPCSAVAFDQRARRALATDPDLVVIEGGLNDFDQPAADIRAGFRRLLREVGDRHVLVVGPPSAPQRARSAARVDAILRAEAAQTGTPYLSMLRQHFDYLPDRLHLTASGHRQFGALVAEFLRDPSQLRR